MDDRTDDDVMPAPSRTGTFVGVLIAIVILVAGGYGMYSLGQSQSNQTAAPVAEEESATPSIVEDTTETAVAESNTTLTDDGVTWLAKPEPVSSLKLIAPTAQAIADDPNFAESLDAILHYYKIGTDKGKDIVLLYVSPEGPGYPSAFMFIKTAADKYEFLEKNSDSMTQFGDLSTLGNSVTRNTTKEYRSLAKQASLTVKGISLTALAEGYEPDASVDWFPAQDDGNPTIASRESRELVTTSPYGKLYHERYGAGGDGEAAKDRGFLSSYVLIRPNFTQARYQLSPSFQTDDGVPQVTWNDGSKNTDSYRLDGGGSCGAPFGYYVLTDASRHSLESAGTTNNGETVYAFKNLDDVTVTDFYNTYAPDGLVYDYSGAETKQVPGVSKEDFLRKYHAVFVYKDALGRSIVFSSNSYGSQAECGKPVIYLYPERTTDVSVKVGADIRISEPAYGGGWNVRAEPDGHLTLNDGSQYRSLFWEGQGHGQYPMIDSGFVVAQADLASSLREHLSKLGLNAQEAADFLEFWLPKMPKNPYVRLTWFGTRQMDELAPLEVMPKPDTSIRIFLDFAGLDQPIDLAPQRLSAPARRGFTLVEWGGLLRK